MTSTVLLYVLLIALWAPESWQSSGDQLPEFRKCMKKCLITKVHCPDPMPLALRVTGWSCESNCRYECMHTVLVEYPHTKGPHQFYGKWPFYRLWGIQEPASVLFSLMNAWAQWKAFRRIQSEISPEYQPLKQLYQGTCLLQIHAWFWSAVFHTRDLPFTEKMDYFSAMAVLFYGVYVAAYRVLNMHRGPSSSIQWWLAMSLGLYYLGHINYLGFIHFDYGYNMMVGVIVGVVHSLIWSYWFWNNRKLPHAKFCIMSIVGVMSAMSLELLDFYPLWDSIDAHALWHLATVPLTFLWNHFLVLDANNQIRSTKYM